MDKYFNKEYIKDISQYEIIVQIVNTVDTNNNNNFCNYQYQYTFYESEEKSIKIYTNKPLFLLLEQYNQLKDLQIKIISLQSKPNRRIGLCKQFDKESLKYEIFYGFDGKNSNMESFPPSDIKCLLKNDKNCFMIYTENETYLYDPSIRPNKKVLSNGEIGCAIAHLRLYETLNDNNFLTLVLEDDAHIDNFDRFYSYLRNIPNYETFDIIYLQNEATWWAPIYDKPVNEFYITTKKGSSVNLTLSFIITPNFIRMLKYFHQLVQQQLFNSPPPSKYKFICLPSDDLISHMTRNNLLRCIIPYLRFISSQHLSSHIGEVSSSISQLKYSFTSLLITGIDSMWTGLGNQMFQYASAKLFSLFLRKKLVGDIQGSKLLYSFKNIEISPVDKTKINSIKLELEEPNEHEILNEIYSINEDTVKKYLEQNISIKGYFQHAKYYEPYSYIVKELFQFHPTIIKNASIYLQKIKNDYPNHTLVAIHIRRKDFRNDNSLFQYNLYTPNTLNLSIQKFENEFKIKNENKSILYLIFSNDIQDVQNEFDELFKSQSKPYIFVNLPSFKQSGQHKDGSMELCVMKECDHFIISASSFSWWAAFLSKNDEKIVIMPKVWYNPLRTEFNHLKNASDSLKCEKWIQC